MDYFPEGLAINPTGDLAVALALNGSGGSVSKDAWYADPNTIVAVLSTAGGTVLNMLEGTLCVPVAPSLSVR
jgi:hypothetical protein